MNGIYTNGQKVANAFRQMQTLLIKSKPKDKSEKEIRNLFGMKKYEK